MPTRRTCQTRAGIGSGTSSRSPSLRLAHHWRKRSARTRRRSRTRRPPLEPLVREKLAIQRHDDAVALGVLGLLHVDREIDGAHDAVAEVFLNHVFERRPVYTQNLVKPIHERIGRHDLASQAVAL